MLTLEPLSMFAVCRGRKRPACPRRVPRASSSLASASTTGPSRMKPPTAGVRARSRKRSRVRRGVSLRRGLRRARRLRLRRGGYVSPSLYCRSVVQPLTRPFLFVCRNRTRPPTKSPPKSPNLRPSRRPIRPLTRSLPSRPTRRPRRTSSPRTRAGVRVERRGARTRSPRRRSRERCRTRRRRRTSSLSEAGDNLSVPPSLFFRDRTQRPPNYEQELTSADCLFFCVCGAFCRRR